MSKNKKKFSELWRSATDIAYEFGISAVALNKLLAEEGLRDPAQKAPTRLAISQDFAMPTPLKSGIAHYMWNTEKIVPIIEATHPRLSPREVKFDEFVRQLLEAEREAEKTGFDKFIHLYAGEAAPEFRGISRSIVESVCRRRGITARTAEFQELVA